MICGLLPPSAGTVEVFGAARPLGGAAMMRETGWLLSEPALFQYLTAPETLTFLASVYEIEAETARQRVANLLDFFELREHADQLSDELSTGTAKRLALAAAMIHAPRLLVLDEPLSHSTP